ncbi:DUF2284 domain-containing protein [Clostridiaceae bacterium]|nr:DUF2284 domain-containing protein [Clostridiaceae bacterium]
MNKSEKEAFLKYIRQIAPSAEVVFMEPKEAVFEELVKMNCFYCGKYGRNWKCPPNIPDIDYPKMFSEFDEGAFISYSFEIHDSSAYEGIRSESSIVLHKTLLQLEKWMWEHDRSTALSFGAGSCKLCKGGCGKERCNNPYRSRTPLEATGVNIIKTAAKYGIEIHFPTDRLLTRIGLIMWQNPIRVYKTTEEI